MTPEDIDKTAWEVWARSRKEVMCADQVAILAAALMEERERDRWLPIETAPKDGAPVLIWEGGTRAAWFEREYSWVSRGGAWISEYARSDTYEYNPDFWQPLPSPPSTDKAEKP